MRVADIMPIWYRRGMTKKRTKPKDRTPVQRMARLRQLLDTHSVTRAQAAQLMRLSYSYLTNAINGQYVVSEGHLTLLEMQLGVRERDVIACNGEDVDQSVSSVAPTTDDTRRNTDQVRDA